MARSGFSLQVPSCFRLVLCQDGQEMKACELKVSLQRHRPAIGWYERGLKSQPTVDIGDTESTVSILSKIKVWIQQIGSYRGEKVLHKQCRKPKYRTPYAVCCMLSRVYSPKAKR